MDAASPNDLDLALAMADAADALTMAAFTGRGLAFTTKADGSPVSDTDLAVESALRDLLRLQRPTDGFLGEETGASGAAGERCWIVDPVDGTQSFVTGGRNWGTQIALRVGAALVVGVTSAPAAGARWWAGAGRGAFRRFGPDASAAPLRVSTGSSLHTARWVCHPAPADLTGDRRTLADRLVAAAGDGPRSTSHGALMVANGSAEVCLTLEGAPWDYAAFASIVTAAGGRFSYLDGSTDLDGVRPALFSNGALHDRALEALAG